MRYSTLSSSSNSVSDNLFTRYSLDCVCALIAHLPQRLQASDNNQQPYFKLQPASRVEHDEFIGHLTLFVVFEQFPPKMPGPLPNWQR